MKPYATRYVKVVLKVAVGVYLPKNDSADQAIADDALRVQLVDYVNWHSDGRDALYVEQIQNAAEQIVRLAIEQLVEDRYRAKPLVGTTTDEGLIQKAIREGGSAGEFAQEKLIEHVALAMARVSVSATPVSDEHVLDIEIEGDP
jgi:hypothetical protein